MGPERGSKISDFIWIQRGTHIHNYCLMMGARFSFGSIKKVIPKRRSCLSRGEPRKLYTSAWLHTCLKRTDATIVTSSINTTDRSSIFPFHLASLREDDLGVSAPLISVVAFIPVLLVRRRSLLAHHQALKKRLFGPKTRLMVLRVIFLSPPYSLQCTI